MAKTKRNVSPNGQSLHLKQKSLVNKQTEGIKKCVWKENKLLEFQNGQKTSIMEGRQSPAKQFNPNYCRRCGEKKKSTLEQEKLRGNKGNTWLFCEP